MARQAKGLNYLADLHTVIFLLLYAPNPLKLLSNGFEPAHPSLLPLGVFIYLRPRAHKTEIVPRDFFCCSESLILAAVLGF